MKIHNDGNDTVCHILYGIHMQFHTVLFYYYITWHSMDFNVLLEL